VNQSLKALFYNVDSSSYAVSSILNYPTDGTTTPNDSVAKVNGSTRPVGPALLLKVMSGDSVTIVSKYFYKSSGASSGNQNQAANIIAFLAQGLVDMTDGAHGSTSYLTGGTSPVSLGVNDFMIDYDASIPAKPQAYLNWILMDNQFKYDSASSGALPVSTPDVLGAFSKQVKLKKSGYLYIWVSNETKGWDVFFHNLKVMHYVGPMVEENHYYPFGLTMAGISDKALKGWYPENKYRYNKGSELQNNEFSDGSGLEMYETPLRSLDPQLGRWWQVDPSPDESETPYAAMDNNPLLKNDPLGDVACCALSGEAWQATQKAAEGLDPATAELVTLAGIALTVAAATEELGIQNRDPMSMAPPGTQAMISHVHADLQKQQQEAELGSISRPSTRVIKLNLPADTKKPVVVKAEAKKFDGQQDTHSETRREAFRKAKDQNGVPRSAQPDKTSTTRDKNTGKPLRTYEYTNSKGKKIVIRKDNPVTYPDGGQQGEHYNAGNPAENNGKLKQHHNYGNQ